MRGLVRSLPGVVLIIAATNLGCSESAAPTQRAGSGGGGGSGSSAGAPSNVGGEASGGGATGGSAGTGLGGARSVPTTCAEALIPYALGFTELDASLVPFLDEGGWNGELRARLPVAIDGAHRVYVGLTRVQDDTYAAVIADEQSSVAAEFAGAALGGFQVTGDGFGALLFDPNTSVDDKRWAAVARVQAGGAQTFNRDLFRSPNLADVGTKGAPDTSRLAYVPETDQLLAYFGHTERSDDDVRHQGGYLASVDGNGTVAELSGWFGSHNLDQRLLVSGGSAAQLGLGDAYPKGIFFSFIDDPQTHVIYTLAADSSGTVNGQLGGIVDLGSSIVVPFITNRSITQDLDPGPWPNPDQAIADQIRAAASRGTDLGLLTVTKGAALPDADLTPVWIDTELPDAAKMESLKSARYGQGELVFLAWKELSGEGEAEVSKYYTMVVDAQGNVCQPKTELDASHGFLAGDDVVSGADSRLVWANAAEGRIRVVTLTP